MRAFFRYIFLFLAIAGAVSLLSEHSAIDWGTRNFWEIHGFLLLLGLALFPRLTLLALTVFTGFASGGLVWWLSWIFFPRILVAVLATVGYWHSNPGLVFLAWVFALSGEWGEKFFIRKRRRPRFAFRSWSSAPSAQANGSRRARVKADDDSIEAEYSKL